MVPFVPAPGHCSDQLVQPLRSCLRVMTTAWRPDQRPGAPQGIGAACWACCGKLGPVCAANGRLLKVLGRWPARRCAVLGAGFGQLWWIQTWWRSLPRVAERACAKLAWCAAGDKQEREHGLALKDADLRPHFERSLRVRGSGGVFGGGAGRLRRYSSVPARDAHAPPCPSSSRQS